MTPRSADGSHEFLAGVGSIADGDDHDAGRNAYLNEQAASQFQLGLEGLALFAGALFDVESATDEQSHPMVCALLGQESQTDKTVSPGQMLGMLAVHRVVMIARSLEMLAPLG